MDEQGKPTPEPIPTREELNELIADRANDPPEIPPPAPPPPGLGGGAVNTVDRQIHEDEQKRIAAREERINKVQGLMNRASERIRDGWENTR